MSGGLPSLYAAWMDELLAAPIPDEKIATCDDCPMCRTSAVAPLSFRPELKCCTYVPELPNFLVGRILSDDDPTGAAGRATVIERIRTGDAVTPLGLGRPPALDRLYSDSGSDLFGRSKELRCPHYLSESGHCGIWRHRNAICTSWFCKHSRGGVGMRFWATVRDLLGAVEKNLSQWCLLEMECDPETLLRELPTRRAGQPEPEVPIEAAARRLAWGSWFGREDEYYVECARRVGEPTWASVMARSGPDVHIRARQVQHTYRKLTSKELPDALTVKSLQVFQMSEKSCCVSAYSPLDPLAMPVELLTALRHFDGSPTAAALEAISTIEGLRLTPRLVQKLVDFEILEPLTTRVSES